MEKWNDVLNVMSEKNVFLSNVIAAELLDSSVDELEELYLLLIVQGYIDCSKEYAREDCEDIEAIGEVLGKGNYYYAAKTVMMFSFYLDTVGANCVRHWTIASAMGQLNELKEKCEQNQEKEKILDYLTDLATVATLLDAVLNIMQDCVIDHFSLHMN